MLFEDLVKKYPVFKLRNNLIDAEREISTNFLGRVLTIIDASISDQEQRKGIKDLIKNEFYRNLDFNQYCKDTLYSFFEDNAPEMLPKDEENRLALRGMDSPQGCISSK